MIWRTVIRRLAFTAAGASAVGFGSLFFLPKAFEFANARKWHAPASDPRRSRVLAAASAPEQQQVAAFTAPPPTRDEQLRRLREDEFDLLVIGGGATGCGVALDAQTRGLKTALVERADFASGTSSKSTKLIHGGVRYLQSAILHLDFEQYRMVKEALSERAHLLHVAPHIASPLAIMLPIYKWYQIPYYWTGIKMYDLVSGRKLLKSSYMMSKSRALEHFPMLKREQLKAALVYYDGQMDDTRMCLALALTSTKLGASISNYCEVLELDKTYDANLKKVVCSGALVRDRLTGVEFHVRAKAVVNATGPYTDAIRQLDKQETKPICEPSAGVHIILPDYYCSRDMGLLDPNTKDGRVIFFLPWQAETLAGTTDSHCSLSEHPKPTEKEVQFILSEIREYLSNDVMVRRGDVLASWSGIRPLVKDPNKADTQSLARNHVIEVSDSRLVTIAGGKWTTFREMAEETVDTALKAVPTLAPTGPCRTRDVLLDGAHGYSPTLFIRLVQDFGLESDVARHLAESYGDKAFKVAKLATTSGRRWPVVGTRLHPEFPYLDVEVVWAVREYAMTAVDVIGRRLRLAFLNNQAAEESLPRVIELMAHELKWDKKRQQEELESARKFLQEEMGMGLRDEARANAPINLSADEMAFFRRKFREIDSSKKGFITVNDLRRYFKERQERIDENQLRSILNDLDTNKNGEIDLGEFLQFVSAWKTGTVSHSRFATIVNEAASELGSSPKTFKYY